MPDDTGNGDSSGRLWRSFARLFTGERDATLRDQIEDAIEEHEGDADTNGDLSPAERQMLKNLLNFDKRNAGAVAVPRAAIVALPETASFDTLAEAFVESGHSRLLVYRDDLDEVTGMIHIRDAFAALARGERPASIVGLIRQPRFVPETMPALDVLADMRQHRVHLAVVLDEYSGTEGILTIEDLVEEIVGEIEDEHDEAAEAMLVAIDGGCWDADARAELGEVARVVDPRLGEVDEDVDTLGGLAFVLAGHVPQPGETLVHPSGWRLEVTEGDPRRASRVRLHPPPTARLDAA